MSIGRRHRQRSLQNDGVVTRPAIQNCTLGAGDQIASKLLDLHARGWRLTVNLEADGQWRCAAIDGEGQATKIMIARVTDDRQRMDHFRPRCATLIRQASAKGVWLIR